MEKVKIEFHASKEMPKIEKGISLLIEFFEINKIHPSDAISIASNFLVKMFIDEDEKTFHQYLESLRKSYEMNSEIKIGYSAKKQK